MLGDVFQRFVAQSPLSVMVLGTLERVLGADQLDVWYERTTQKPQTRKLLFSTVYELMIHAVSRLKPSVHTASRDTQAEVGTSVVLVSNTLNRLATHTAAELVRSRSRV
jgi:hypothetical protein